MKRLLILWSILISGNYSFSQGINNLWLLGYDCCQPLLNPMNLDFSSGFLTISQSQRSMNFGATNSEICDNHDNLLFYSNGVYIANVMDDTMQNGLGLNPSFYTSNYAAYGLNIPQGNLIIPFPDDSMKYYLFHQTIDDYASYASLFLYYSVIDMSLDGGLGAVIQKNTILLSDSLVPGRIAAVKHANGRDWWVIVHQFHSGIIYKFLVTPQGIQGPWQQDLVTWRDIGVGQAVFSQQGNKFVYYEPYDDLDIWDFDRCTGDFANLIHIEINDTAYSAGAAFSPSGRYLYISSMYYLYQYDLLATNVDSSRITVGVYDGFNTNGFPSAYYLAALAPDGKIYINTSNSTWVLHVINNPDSAGLACDFCQHCINLPAFNAYTIPNHPNYFLGAEGNSVCDSLVTGISGVRSLGREFLVFPNPTTGEFNLVYTIQGDSKLQILDCLGRICKEYNLPAQATNFKGSLESLENGLYYYRIVDSKDELLNTGKVILNK